MRNATGVERHLPYWQAKLGDADAQLVLPYDRPRRFPRSHQVVRHPFALTDLLTSRLRHCQRDGRHSLEGTFLSAFAALLHRYSGESALRVAVSGAEDAYLSLIQPLGRQPVSSLLADVDAALNDARAHPLPLSLLALQQKKCFADGLDGDEDLCRVAAFHHPFGEEMWYSNNAPQLEGAPFFDLTLVTEESADGVLSGAFVYAAELFLPSTITRLTGHYLALLEQVAQNPSITLNQLALLSDAEQAQITRWNAAADQTVEKLFVPIHTALTAQAEMYGDRIALCHGVTTVSCDELNIRSNRLAHRLIASGVKAEARVGVSIERSAEMIIALLAILKAGGAFVPLDPRYPAARLSYMLSDAGVQHLVTQRGLSTVAITPDSMTTLYVEDVQNEDSTEYDHPPAVVIHPSQSAYLIYTSGSTGQPKGVTVEHGPLARHCQAIGERYQMSVEDRVLHFASINFDLAHEYWLMPLLFGARLVITDNVLWSPAETCAQLAHHGVTVAAFPPSYLVQLAEAAQARQDKLALRVLAFGGEALSREHFELVRTVFAPATLINGYGPTETVISPMLWITQPDTDPAEWQHNAYLPIGTPVGARSAYVLDAALNALPVGVAGELYLGGAELARGYHARAGMTAERFIPDPFCAGGRLYRTGDRARWRSDGSVDYLGRLDHQVKLRGVRIEPGEIEAQLLACLGVREAAVLVHGDGGDGQLVAYLVAEESGAPLDRTLLKSQLQQRLPDYMVPAQFMLLDRLPVTANGKLDRRALPAPTWKGRAYRAPESVVEISLGTIWAEVLKLDRVGLDDHFFELGGHSLLATQATALIRERLLIDMSLADFFEHPTLTQCAAHLSRHVGAARLTEADDLSDMDALLQALEN
ncbi:amino acid adenylation domain-containing protein [Glaciimonas sp. CA11.2]|uniref:amino acid adenylation domain-containing protein n=4 Tax=Glaciimonas sp. CA11.2 TaxID=3048601 RepID=UPI002AB5B980|nr:amino acid adenylation domain-containing protein [Glaciimonas sp. CA11.2]MDY7547456.1 amino acid adenylation domain-containing protein [Glaciimonas sp. CA11.2]